MSDRVIQLLQDVDERSGAPSLQASELANRVRHSAHRRKRRRAIAGSCAAAMLLITTVVAVAMHRSSLRPTVVNIDTEDFAIQANLHERIAATLISHESRA